MRIYSIYQFILHICLLSLITVYLFGCRKFLDIPAPITELETEKVFANSATANSAILGIYGRMVTDGSGSYNISLLTGVWTDELTNYSTNQDILSFYMNSLNSENRNIQSQFWAPSYYYIYQANTILESLSQSASLNSGLKKQLEGEAKFIRAFWHFILTNLFNDIPIITSTDYVSNAAAPRSNSKAVYEQIINDLKDAENLLSEEYVGVDGLTPTEERIRPNRYCASSLLAKVYLYAGENENAEAYASKCILNSQTYFLTPLNEVFLRNSHETILALQPSTVNGYNTPEGLKFILTGAPSSGSSNCTAMNPLLLNSFEPGDLRKSEWISNFDTYYYPSKYKINSSSDLLEYSIVLRLSEQYLIRAEARANIGKIEDSLNDLNIIRRRAGLKDLFEHEKKSLLKAIANERKLELFTEWGNRWFDIRRHPDADVVMASIAASKGSNWESYKRNLPIPESERLNNPNLSQNSGY